MANGSRALIAVWMLVSPSTLIVLGLLAGRGPCKHSFPTACCAICGHGYPNATGQPVTVKFALYAAQAGGDPVWSEMQSITPDSKGRYTVLLGSATEGGLPQSSLSPARKPSGSASPWAMAQNLRARFWWRHLTRSKPVMRRHSAAIPQLISRSFPSTLNASPTPLCTSLRSAIRMARPATIRATGPTVVFVLDPHVSSLYLAAECYAAL